MIRPKWTFYHSHFKLYTDIKALNLSSCYDENNGINCTVGPLILRNIIVIAYATVPIEVGELAPSTASVR